MVASWARRGEDGLGLFTVLAALMVLAGVLLAVLAASAARHGGAAAGRGLAVLLLAVAWWGFAYAVELSVSDVPDRELWGDLKYAGVATLAPAYLVFVLQYTNRGHLLSRRLLLALAVEPVLVMAALLTPATHDLVRSYPPSVAAGEVPVVETGALFWVHFAYVNAVLLLATVVFVGSVARVSRLYRRTAMVLVAAALLPWTANVLHNFAVGPFARVDLTPFAFVVTGAVLYWGLFRQRLVSLAPSRATWSWRRWPTPCWCSTPSAGSWTPTRPPPGRSAGAGTTSWAGRWPT